MAAEVLSGRGLQVEVYDAMPSVGRKFLLAGKGGMNITHSELIAPFLERYGARHDQIAPLHVAQGISVQPLQPARTRFAGEPVVRGRQRGRRGREDARSTGRIRR